MSSSRRREGGRFDHRQDDKMTFETSESVTAVKRFEDLGLKEDLLRGIYAYSMFVYGGALTDFSHRFREAFSHSAASYWADYCRPRCHCTGSVWYR